jgi:hypothetical protein
MDGRERKTGDEKAEAEKIGEGGMEERLCVERRQEMEEGHGEKATEEKGKV